MRFNAKVIILRGMDYGESDRIIRILVENLGKASAIAKGARKEKSKLREGVEPLTLGTYQLNTGRNMYTISQADIIDTFPAIKDSLESLMTAIFLSELVDEFMEEGNPDMSTFDLFISALNSLDATNAKWEQTAVYFEVQLHVINGVFPDLHQCVLCGSTKSSADVRLDLENGGALCSVCSAHQTGEESYPMNSLFILDMASELPLDKFLQMEFDENNLNAAGKIISRFTSYYLGKKLKSRAIMDSTLKNQQS